jgi:hypothetical protein
MITVPTHKRHKSPFETIYVFTSGREIVIVQIHSTKDFEGVIMTTAKWPPIQGRSRIYAMMLQDLMKRGVCRRVVEMLLEVAACLIYITSPSKLTCTSPVSMPF